MEGNYAKADLIAWLGSAWLQLSYFCLRGIPIRPSQVARMLQASWGRRGKQQRNKIHQTWERPYKDSQYVYVPCFMVSLIWGIACIPSRSSNQRDTGGKRSGHCPPLILPPCLRSAYNNKLYLWVWAVVCITLHVCQQVVLVCWGQKWEKHIYLMHKVSAAFFISVG